MFAAPFSKMSLKIQRKWIHFSFSFLTKNKLNELIDLDWYVSVKCNHGDDVLAKLAEQSDFQ